MLSIQVDVKNTLEKKLEDEKAKYESVASQKAKLMADMQALLQIVEEDKQRQIEEVANAYYLEHVVVNYENPLSMP